MMFLGLYFYKIGNQVIILNTMKWLVNWKKGDYVIYSTNTLHAASNIGIKPRYTLQVTGIKKVNKMKIGFIGVGKLEKKNYW